MFGFPTLPPYEGMHPLVVHFPIGILLIAWVPMVVGLIDRKRRSGWLLSAMLLLVIGTVFAFGAVLTGEAAEDIIGSKTQEIGRAIHEHEETAEMARNLFIGVTVLYAIVLILRWKLTNPENPNKKKPAVMVGGLLVAIVYIFGALALANAGHQGGMLVHDLGIHAPVGVPSSSGIQPGEPVDHND